MSYETDNLKREIDSLRWQKAEVYKVDELFNSINYLKQRIINLENNLDYYRERLEKLEQKELERENG